MKRHHPSIVLALLVVPLLVRAADLLPESLDRAEHALQLVAGDEAIRSDDRALEEHPELFPATGESRSSKSTLDHARNERTVQFVMVQTDGREVALRDVPRQSWFAPYVRDVAERGLVSGYRDAEGIATGLFGPQDNVTVEQLSKIVVLAKHADIGNCPLSKNLTASGSWSVTFIGCAESAGWALFADGSVDVHRHATRSEVLVTLMQAFEVPYTEAVEAPFEDVPPTMQFSGFIARAKADGLVAGYTDDAGMPAGLFGPVDPVTRAETAKMVSLAVQLYSP